MKTPKTAALTALIALLLGACNRPLLDEQRTFPSQRWNRFTPETFELDIKNADLYFNIDFTVSFDTAAYRYDRLPLVIDIRSADGSHRHMEPKVMLKENGRWKGEQQGALRVVKTRAYNCFSFNQPGHYTYSVKQGTSQYDLEGIHSLHITITPAKLDFDNLR